MIKNVSRTYVRIVSHEQKDGIDMATAAGSAAISGTTAGQRKRDWLHVNYAGLIFFIMMGLSFISAGLAGSMQEAVSALMSQPFETDSWLSVYKNIMYLFQHPSEVSLYYMAYIVEVSVQDLLLFFGTWRLFRKAGLRGWEFLIPIYNIYCLFEVAGIKGLWLGSFIFIGALLECGLMSGLTNAACYFTVQNGTFSVSNIQGASYFLILFAVCFVIVTIVALYQLARRFGHGGWFTVGLLLFSTLFFLMLCWDDHQASEIDYSEDSANRKAAVALIVIAFAITLIVSAAVTGNALAMLMSGQGNIFNLLNKCAGAFS